MLIRIQRQADRDPCVFELPDTLDGQAWSDLSLVSAFAYIHQHLDPTFTYAVSCARGNCNVCVVRVNGKVETACTVAVVDNLLVEPTRPSIQLRDMMVELSLVRRARL
jgi:succinate dehydrogenase/fumarate reductase-like Fe-S protein